MATIQDTPLTAESIATAKAARDAERRQLEAAAGVRIDENGLAMRVPRVYGCIAAVSASLAQVGISKDRSNASQGYKFRGIDDVYNALAPLLAKHGLVIIPRILSRIVTERVTQKGGTLFNVTVEAEFDFVSATDGSKTTARSFGEAMDSADKATNKAMSAAYKYTAFQTFCIPTEGDNDADATTHEPSRPVDPEGFEDWLIDLEAVADNGTAALELAWKKSQPYMRKHLTDTNKKKWEQIKEKAAKVTPKTEGA